MMSKRVPNPYPLRQDIDNPLLADYSDLDLFLGKPFYCGDQSKKGFHSCCFSHIVQCPMKLGREDPMYDYELDVVNTIENNRNVWIKKASGIGATELILRYLAWKILVNNELEYKNIFIVSGTFVAHANELKVRMENLFRRTFPDLQFNSKFTQLQIKNTIVKIFPSRNVKDLRGYTDVAYLFIDEADYFDQSVTSELLAAITRYEEKSRCTTIMCSTPFKPGGLFETIEKDPNSKYKKILLPYQIGLDKIFDRQEILRKQKEPEFGREYGLQYLGKVGNVILPSEVDNCIRLGELYRNQPIGNQTLLSCGIDWGFSSSATGIVLLERIRPINKDGQIDDVIIVRDSQLIEKGNVDKICNDLFDLYRKRHNTWFICDGSNRAATNLLKIKFNESFEWDSNDVNPDNMKVVPINFSTSHKDLLSHMQSMVANSYLAIPERGNEQLITALRTAWARELSLDKNVSVYNDLTDALRLGLRAYSIK